MAPNDVVSLLRRCLFEERYCGSASSSSSPSPSAPSDATCKRPLPASPYFDLKLRNLSQACAAQVAAGHGGGARPPHDYLLSVGRNARQLLTFTPLECRGNNRASERASVLLTFPCEIPVAIDHADVAGVLAAASLPLLLERGAHFHSASAQTWISISASIDRRAAPGNATGAACQDPGANMARAWAWRRRPEQETVASTWLARWRRPLPNGSQVSRRRRRRRTTINDGALACRLSRATRAPLYCQRVLLESGGAFVCRHQLALSFVCLLARSALLEAQWHARSTHGSGVQCC